MLRDAINEHEVNVFAGSGDLYFDMGKVCLMLFPFIKQGKFYLTLPASAQLRGKGSFVMVEQLPFCSQADHIILFHRIQLQEHLVVIKAAVHDEGDFPEKCFCALHGGEGDIISGGKILFAGRMDLREDADRVAVCSKDSGLRDMVAFLINIFGRRAFRTIADDAEGFKFMAIGLHDITVINKDNR